MFDALLALFITRELGLPPAAFGLVYAIGSASGLLGAAFGERLTRRTGIGRMIVVAACAIGAGWLTMSFARGTPVAAFAVLAGGFVVAGLGNTLYNIGVASLSQAVTPDRLLGRMNATRLFIGWGTLPVGSLIGGFLGQAKRVAGRFCRLNRLFHGTAGAPELLGNLALVFLLDEVCSPNLLTVFHCDHLLLHYHWDRRPMIAENRSSGPVFNCQSSARWPCFILSKTPGRQSPGNGRCR